MSDKLNRSYVDEKGNSFNESSYELLECIITNVNGDSSDIRNMVGFIKIHESLFAPSIVAEIGIRDEVNFLEEFSIIGNEKIKLSIKTKALGIENVIEFSLRAQKYHDYARSANDNQTQAYVLVAISEYAYVAPLKIITYSNDLPELHEKIIAKIFKRDLNTPIVVKGNMASTYKGNLNLQNPIRACQKLVESAFDFNQTPYFLYQDLSSNVYLSPLSFINDREENKVYRTFNNDKQLRSDPNSKINYFERSSQILKISSNIGLSPSLQAKKGAFASEHRYINLSRKEWYAPSSQYQVPDPAGPSRASAMAGIGAGNRVKLNLELDINPEHTTSKKLPRVGTAPINGDIEEPLSQASQARVQYHFVNNSAQEVSSVGMSALEGLAGMFQGSGFDLLFDTVNEFIKESSMGQLSKLQKHRSEAYMANYDACSHKFEVMGDPLLNPGRTIQLLFPKSTSPEALKNRNDIYDKVLSGDYLIFSTMHTFMDGTHTTEVVAKTDSIQPTENL
jgi:hypothetical protein